MFKLSLCKDLFYLRIWRINIIYLRTHKVNKFYNYINLVGIGFYLSIYRFNLNLTPIKDIEGQYIDFRTI